MPLGVDRGEEELLVLVLVLLLLLGRFTGSDLCLVRGMEWKKREGASYNLFLFLVFFKSCFGLVGEEAILFYSSPFTDFPPCALLWLPLLSLSVLLK